MYVKQGLPMLWAIFSSVQRKIVKRAVSRVKFPCVLGSQLSRSSSRLLNIFMPYLKVQTELVFASNSVSTHSKRSINLAISLQKLYFICHPFLSLSLCLCLNSLFLYLSISISLRPGMCWEKRSFSCPDSDLGWLSSTPFCFLSIMKSSLLCLWNILGIQFASPYIIDNCFLYEQFLHQHYIFSRPL